MSRGLFISLDGVDGAGKSTQCQMLVQWLREQGRDALLCRDPGGTPLGDRIRELLLPPHSPPSEGGDSGGVCEMTLACEALLYMASRAQLVEQIVRPALERGQIVISDRYLLANVVYQGHAGGLLPQQLWDLGKMATGGLLPHLTLVLDLPLEVALLRKAGPADRMEERGAAFLNRVREGFLSEARRSPESIRVIDGNQALDVVHECIRREVARVLGEYSGA